MRPASVMRPSTSTTIRVSCGIESYRCVVKMMIRCRSGCNPRFVGSYNKGTHPPFRLFLTIHGDGIALDRRMRIQPQVAPTIPADKDVQHLEEQCCRRSDGLRQCLTSVP